MTWSLLLLALLPRPSAAVSRAVADLGHESWHEREAAHRRLLGLGLAAVPALEVARDHPDLEIATRAERLLDYELAAAVAAKEEAWVATLPAPLPCCDCLAWHGTGYGGPLLCLRAYEGRVRHTADFRFAGVGVYPVYRRGTARMLCDLRRLGVPEPWLLRLLEHMAARERRIPPSQGGGGLP